jgi:glycosyltransferase involved in cell wall biosynthesis
MCVIPAYTEEGTIQSIVTEARKYCNTVIVVNDGSQDRTHEKAENVGAFVISHLINLGVGAALETGFKAALKQGADIVVSLDADGQHDPAEIPKLVRSILEREADVVVGSRVLSSTETMPFIKKVGNKVLSILTSILCGCPIKDSQCGYRAYSRVALEKLTCLPKDYVWASDILAQLRRQDFVIKEVPIKAIYNRSIRRMKGTDIIVGIKIFFNLLRSKFQ